ncbi:MAG: outer membrane lipoprotein-sorting protein [Chitinophagaceae bacterium]|nr:outer membrane lipoprotein-sorting protein [Chitinophagaceae bacterium]
MKNLRIALFTVASFVAFSVNAQTLDEIVDKHITALGGKEKLSTLKSVRMETNLSVQGMDIPVISTAVHNVGQRVDISAMGMEGYVITTPTKGWTFMPFMGQSAPEATPEDQVKDGLDELDLQGSLNNYKEKGHKVELVGKEDVDGTEAYKLKLTTQSGKDRTLFIDPKNFYIIRQVKKAVVNGQEMEVTINFSDYKKTEDGFVFPHSIGGAFGQGDMTVTKIEVNKPVDEKIFKVN